MLFARDIGQITKVQMEDGDNSVLAAATRLYDALPRGKAPAQEPVREVAKSLSQFTSANAAKEVKVKMKFA